MVPLLALILSSIPTASADFIPFLLDDPDLARGQGKNAVAEILYDYNGARGSGYFVKRRDDGHTLLITAGHVAHATENFSVIIGIDPSSGEDPKFFTVTPKQLTLKLEKTKGDVAIYDLGMRSIGKGKFLDIETFSEPSRVRAFNYGILGGLFSADIHTRSCVARSLEEDFQNGVRRFFFRCAKIEGQKYNGTSGSPMVSAVNGKVLGLVMGGLESDSAEVAVEVFDPNELLKDRPTGRYNYGIFHGQASIPSKSAGDFRCIDSVKPTLREAAIADARKECDTLALKVGEVTNQGFIYSKNTGRCHAELDIECGSIE